MSDERKEQPQGEPQESRGPGSMKMAQGTEQLTTWAVDQAGIWGRVYREFKADTEDVTVALRLTMNLMSETIRMISRGGQE